MAHLLLYPNCSGLIGHTSLLILGSLSSLTKFLKAHASIGCKAHIFLLISVQSSLPPFLLYYIIYTCRFYYILYNIILYHIVLYYIMLYYIILCSDGRLVL